MSRNTRRILGCLAVGVVLLVGGLWGYYKWLYPYGWSHCCDKNLAMILEQYADEHGGYYPSGEATPEASLSLLYPKFTNANLLCGKIVPLDVVEKELNAGRRLGPETCGWHYVEGLHKNDDHDLALVWDKAGLGHNGERNRDGGKSVIFVGGVVSYIPGDEWAAFLAKQEKLMASRHPDLVKPAKPKQPAGVESAPLPKPVQPR